MMTYGEQTAKASNAQVIKDLVMYCLNLNKVSALSTLYVKIATEADQKRLKQYVHLAVTAKIVTSFSELCGVMNK